MWVECVSKPVSALCSLPKFNLLSSTKVNMASWRCNFPPTDWPRLFCSSPLALIVVCRGKRLASYCLFSFNQIITVQPKVVFKGHDLVSSVGCRRCLEECPSCSFRISGIPPELNAAVVLVCRVRPAACPSRGPETSSPPEVQMNRWAHVLSAQTWVLGCVLMLWPAAGDAVED